MTRDEAKAIAQQRLDEEKRLQSEAERLIAEQAMIDEEMQKLRHEESLRYFYDTTPKWLHPFFRWTERQNDFVNLLLSNLFASFVIIFIFAIIYGAIQLLLLI